MSIQKIVNTFFVISTFFIFFTATFFIFENVYGTDFVCNPDDIGTCTGMSKYNSTKYDDDTGYYDGCPMYDVVGSCEDQKGAGSYACNSGTSASPGEWECKLKSYFDNLSKPASAKFDCTAGHKSATDPNVTCNWYEVAGKCDEDLSDAVIDSTTNNFTKTKGKWNDGSADYASCNWDDTSTDTDEAGAQPVCSSKKDDGSDGEIDGVAYGVKETDTGTQSCSRSRTAACDGSSSITQKKDCRKCDFIATSETLEYDITDPGCPEDGSADDITVTYTRKSTVKDCGPYKYFPTKKCAASCGTPDVDSDALVFIAGQNNNDANYGYTCEAWSDCGGGQAKQTRTCARVGYCSSAKEITQERACVLANKCEPQNTRDDAQGANGNTYYACNAWNASACRNDTTQKESVTRSCKRTSTKCSGRGELNKEDSTLYEFEKKNCLTCVEPKKNIGDEDPAEKNDYTIKMPYTDYYCAKWSSCQSTDTEQARKCIKKTAATCYGDGTDTSLTSGSNKLEQKRECGDACVEPDIEKDKASSVDYNTCSNWDASACQPKTAPADAKTRTCEKKNLNCKGNDTLTQTGACDKCTEPDIASDALDFSPVAPYDCRVWSNCPKDEVGAVKEQMRLCKKKTGANCWGGGVDDYTLEQKRSDGNVCATLCTEPAAAVKADTERDATNTGNDHYTCDAQWSACVLEALQNADNPQQRTRKCKRAQTDKGRNCLGLSRENATFEIIQSLTCPKCTADIYTCEKDEDVEKRCTNEGGEIPRTCEKKFDCKEIVDGKEVDTPSPSKIYTCQIKTGTSDGGSFPATAYPGATLRYLGTPGTSWIADRFLYNDGKTGIGIGLTVGTTPTSILDINGAFTLRKIAEPSPADTDQARMYFDGSKIKISIGGKNKGAYSDLGSGGTGTGGSSQWADITGGGIYYTGGNVGIGTTQPGAKLDVNGDIASGNNFDWNKQATANSSPEGSLIFTTTHSSGVNPYTYYKISNPNYTVVSGDYLEYDVYCNINNPTCTAGTEVDYNNGFGRDTPLKDQNGIANTGGDISAFANGRWYHRRVDLSSAVGKIMRTFSVVEESNTPGTYVSYYRKIIIVNGSTTKNIIWNGGNPSISELNYGDKSASNYSVGGSYFAGGYFGGNVGIGTTSTGAYKLNVAGDINTTGKLCINGDCKNTWSKGNSGDSNIASNGLVFYVDFNNKASHSGVSATDAPTDLGPKNYKLSLTGNAEFEHKDGIGTFRFDGNNERIEIRDFTVTDNSNTYEAWVYLRDQSGWNSIWDSGEESPLVGVLDGKLRVYQDETDHATIATGKWYHIAAAFDSNNKYNVYVNGKEVSINNSYGRVQRTGGFTEWLGGDAGGETFDGWIAIARAYDRQLSATEILNNYNAEVGRFVSITPDLGIIQSGGNVGIGTTAPAEKLDVAGNITLSGGAKEIQFRSSMGKKEQYVWHTGASLGLGVGSENNSMFITAAGNVGIGTTQPGAKLDVNGDIASGNNFDWNKQATANGSPEGSLIFTTTHSSGVNPYTYYKISNPNYTVVAGDYLEYDVYCNISNPTCTAGTEVDYDNGNGRDTPLKDQNGIANTGGDISAFAKGRWYHRRVDLSSGVNKIIKTFSVVEESNTPGTYVSYYRKIIIVNGSTTKNIIWNGGNPSVSALNYRDASASNYSVGGSYFAGGYFTGNVGIGTITPQRNLHVYGTTGKLMKIENKGNGNAVLEIQSDDNAGQTAINFLDSSGSASGQIAYWPNDTAKKYMTFNTNSIERMRIDSAGNVGIGTTSPGANYKLDVAGNINASGNVSSANFCLGGVCKNSWSEDSGVMRRKPRAVLIAHENSNNPTWTWLKDNNYFSVADIDTSSNADQLAVKSYDIYIVDRYAWGVGDASAKAYDLWKKYGKNVITIGNDSSTGSPYPITGHEKNDGYASTPDTDVSHPVVQAYRSATNIGDYGDSGYIITSINKQEFKVLYRKTGDSSKITGIIGESDTGGIWFHDQTGYLIGNTNGQGVIVNVIKYMMNPWFIETDPTALKLTGGSMTGTITSNADQPLYFTSIGSGTYNKTVIYNNTTNGLYLDLAKKTDDKEGIPIDFHIDSRGGGKNFFHIQGSTGNVGIGTTSPSNVQGWNRVINIHGSDHAKALVTNNAGVKIGLYSHNSWDGAAGSVGTESNHPLRFLTNYTEKMRIDVAGNVGIGTTQPGAKLHVNGNAIIGSTDSGTSPDSFSASLKLWLKSESIGLTDGATITTWSDSSGNGNHFTQSGGNKPTYKLNAVNGKAVVKITSGQTMSTTTNFPAPVTVIYLARQTGGKNGRLLSGVKNNWLLGWWGGGKQKAHFEGWVNNPSGGTDTNWHTYSAVETGSVSTVYEDGAQLASNSNGVEGPNGLQLAGEYSEWSDGEIAEVVVFNKALSDSERQSIERYLSTKYAILIQPRLDVVGKINTATGLCINGDCKTAWSQVGTGNFLPLSGGALTGNLDVKGTIQATGFKLSGGTPQANKLCSTDVSGNITCTKEMPALGTNGNNITLTSGGSVTAPYATKAGDADKVDGLDATQLFNNFGQNHNTYSDFNTPSDFGFRYIQGTANGPDTAGENGQYYNLGIGLGNDYAYSQYAMQFAIPRTPLNNTAKPYPSVRFRENKEWGSWSKIYAGYADSAGALTGNTNNCPNGQYSTGIDASGNAEGCTTETDPIFDKSAAKKITADNITNWNNKQPAGTYLTGVNSIYGVTAGNGNGIKFWDDDAYKIHMGTGMEYWYGPVTDYSIKTNMDSTLGRGWTWGGSGLTPVAAIGNTGNMQIAGNFVSMGSVGIGTTSPLGQLHSKGADNVMTTSQNVAGIGAFTGGGAGCPWCGQYWTSYSTIPGAGVGGVYYGNGNKNGGKAGGLFYGGSGNYVAGGGAAIFAQGGAGSYHGFGGVGVYAKGGENGPAVNGVKYQAAGYFDGNLLSSGGLIVGSAYAPNALRGQINGPNGGLWSTVQVSDGSAIFSGSVGIGTTQPGANYKLDVAGNINASNIFLRGIKLAAFLKNPVTGGGTISWKDNKFSWTDRIITLPAGDVGGEHLNTAPWGSCAGQTINIPAWSVAYMRSTDTNLSTDTGGSCNTLSVASYDTYDPSENDVIIAIHNGDTSNGMLYTAWGIILAPGESYDKSTIKYARKVDINELTIAGNLALTMPSNNPEVGPWNPIWTAVGTGKSLYSDEEFNSGSNSVVVYNNSGGSAVTITRLTGQSGVPNSTGAILKVMYNGDTASPNFGGIYQTISSAANKTFVQRFRAKLPIGKTFVINENQQGSNNTSYWLTNNIGTGKWEEYLRVSHAGNAGTFSSGGHISVTGGSGAFDWYIASMNVYDVTSFNIPFSGSYADLTNKPAATLPLTGGTLSNSADGILTLKTTDDTWLYTNWYNKNNIRKIWMGLDSDLSWFNIQPENGTKGVILGGNVGIGTTSPGGKFHVLAGYYYERETSYVSDWKNTKCSFDSDNYRALPLTGNLPNDYAGLMECYDWSGGLAREWDYDYADTRIRKRRRNVSYLVKVKRRGLVIKEDGKVGIGTMSPDHSLDVSGGILATTGTPNCISNNYGYSFRGDGCFDTGMFSTGDGDLFLYANQNRKLGMTKSSLSFTNGDVNISYFGEDSLVKKDDNYKLALARDRIGLDVAELYETLEDVEVGDVLVASKTDRKLEKSSKAYQEQILGIVSGSPALVFEGSDLKLGSKPDRFIRGTKPPVTLAGRVPVKVSLENGPIKSGDYLTSSSVPGVAMRATEPGNTVGVALENYSGWGDGTVLVFVNIGEKNTSSAIKELQKTNEELKKRLEELEKKAR